MQNTSIIIKKIFKEFDSYSLRHTHASMLAEIGVEQKYIQPRLGHSDIKITIEVYEHTTDTMRSRGRKAINTLFIATCQKQVAIFMQLYLHKYKYDVELSASSSTFYKKMALKTQFNIDELC